MNYFQNNPSRILGTVITQNPNTGRILTDAFGKPRPEVRGTLEDALAMIPVPAAKRYPHQVSTAVRANVAESKIEAAIRLSLTGGKADSDTVITDQATVSLSDSIAIYNKSIEYRAADGSTAYYDISEDEIECFVTFQVGKDIWKKETIQANAWKRYYNPNTDWIRHFKNDLVAYDGNEFIPASIFYSGNIYQKLQDAQLNRAAIVEKVGEQGYAKIIEGLNAVRPKPLRLTKDPREMLIIAPFDRIWDEIEFTEDGDGVAFETPVKVDDAFKRWLEQVPVSQYVAEGGQISSNEYDVKTIWLEGKPFTQTSYLTDEQKANKRRNATIIGQILFERFCIEGISRDMQVKIEYIFNSTRNHYAPVQYHRIPVGFKVSERFKGGKFGIRPAQREGVAFVSNRGTGIVAFDVGVGKTTTAILAIEDGFSKGFFKRPLVIVPNGVYWKWVSEIEGVKSKKDMIRNGFKVKAGELISEGILPHRQVNTFYNIGVGYSIPVDSDNNALPVDVGSISIITYEGLQKIGFKSVTENKLIDRVITALSQGENGRKAALQEQAAQGWIDKALNGTEFNVEDLGFDAIFVDECHNFRNLFKEVKGDVKDDGKRERKHFQSGSSGRPSDLAVKLFMLNIYVQINNKNRNTVGLSATPFTNRATEIYSMMAHFDYEGLKDFGVHNLAQFCSVFIDETSETAWTAKGAFEIKFVIRGYNNIPVLQTMLFRAINYKTGEEAKIPRPQKVVLPLTKDEKGVHLEAKYIVETRLTETKEQSKWLKDSYLFAGENFEESEIFQSGSYPINSKTRKPDGQVLVALNVSRTATVSPLSISLRGQKQSSLSRLTYKDVVASSPKFMYTAGCIKSVRDYHIANNTPVSGQIIYCNIGAELFPYLKEYLVKEIGYLESEVKILNGDTPKGERERIKEGFQDNSIKILIGTAAIREGMDLQNHCSVIYDLFLDWNPTDLHQLMGRGWRFGNKFSHIRIVIPLVENSSDIFTWQKLSEKISRLNSVWARSGQTKMFEEGELNAEELKRGLISDPNELALFQVKQEIAVYENRKITLDSDLNEVSEAINFYDEIKGFETGIYDQLPIINSVEVPTHWQDSEYYKKPKERLLAIQAMPETDLQSVYRKVRAYARFRSKDGSYSMPYVESALIDEHIKATKTLKRVEETILTAYKLPLSELSEAKERIQAELIETNKKLEEVSGQDHYKEVLEKTTAEKQAERAARKTIQERVAEFARLNYLLDCNFGKDMCDLYGRAEQPPLTALFEKSGEDTLLELKSNRTAKDELQEAIEALEIGLEFSDDDTVQTQLKEAIEALKIALEFV